MALPGKSTVLPKHRLNSGQKAAIVYHNVFKYPLSDSDLERWTVGVRGLKEIKMGKSVLIKTGNLKSRSIKERIFKKKTLIANRAASLIAKIPTVKLVAVTGALAMKNAEKDSDIDLMIVTKQNNLWLTRLITYFFLTLAGYQLRRPRESIQKDKLCLNIWLDESALSWDPKDRNIYTAHEIAQIIPLVNKDDIYQAFLNKNKWILDYWPRAVKIDEVNYQKKGIGKNYVINTASGNLLEKVAFKFQYFYMRKKITREIISPHKAIFHPNDWGKVVLKKLSS